LAALSITTQSAERLSFAVLVEAEFEGRQLVWFEQPVNRRRAYPRAFRDAFKCQDRWPLVQIKNVHGSLHPILLLTKCQFYINSMSIVKKETTKPTRQWRLSVAGIRGGAAGAESIVSDVLRPHAFEPGAGLTA
jgi:hypothetical protein